MINVDVQIEQDDGGKVARRLGNTGHIHRAMGDLLDESARIGAQSAEIYAPKGTKRGIQRAISSEHATLQADGSLQAVAGVGPVDVSGLPPTDGADSGYPIAVHEGTGLYGHLNKLITPRRAKAMVFVGKTGLVIARTLKGQRPQPFIGEAFEDVDVYVAQRLDSMVHRITDTDH